VIVIEPLLLVLAPKEMPLESTKATLETEDRVEPPACIVRDELLKAATEAVTIDPADVPNVTLLAFENPTVWKVKLPLEAEAA
jgi:hypothetical protein